MEPTRLNSNASEEGHFKTEVLYGAENAVGRGVQFMANSRKKMDLCYDSRAPSIVVEVPEYRNGYLDVRNRGGKIRVITDITKENLAYCKKLMEFVELRHLAEVKGGIAVNESEYMATTILEEAKSLTQVIYSNVPELVAQGQHIFDTFWDLAMPAQYKIEEIEVGRTRPKTVVVDDMEKATKLFLQMVRSSQSVSIVSSVSAIQPTLDQLSDILRKSPKTLVRGMDGKVQSGFRWLTVIARDNIEIADQLMELGAQMRHVDNLPPVSFALGESELCAAFETGEAGSVSQSVLNSNELAYLAHFGSIFEKLWDEGVDAADRIEEIRSGVPAASIEVIRNHRESISRVWNSISVARGEVLILFSTSGAFRRQLEMGAGEVLRKAHLNGSDVRLLIPSGPGLGDLIDGLREKVPGISVKAINEKLRTNITIVTVDGRECFMFELRDDSKLHSYDAVGVALYSSSSSIVSSYAAIIESLWRETELYEKLEVHDRMQREFINIATHELRTPIQPILGLSEILAAKAEAGSEEKELLGAIWRNARRLSKLAEAILDVTRIESQALNLHREVFDLNELIASAISDLVNSPAVSNSTEPVNISAIYADKKAYVLGDKDRLLQVISNLLTNAIKFTEKGSISVLVRIEESGGPDALEASGRKRKYVTVRVKDSGPGIDPNVFPRLFTKFATGSLFGTGLGLYISKAIIEAHQGTITGMNNADERGATFAFSVPFYSDSDVE